MSSDDLNNNNNNNVNNNNVNNNNNNETTYIFGENDIKNIDENDIEINDVENDNKYNDNDNDDDNKQDLNVESTYGKYNIFHDCSSIRQIVNDIDKNNKAMHFKLISKLLSVEKNYKAILEENKKLYEENSRLNLKLRLIAQRLNGAINLINE